MPQNFSTPQTGDLISPELKKMLVPICVTLLLSFGGSWYASNQSQGEIRFQTQANKEAIAAQGEIIKADREALNQLVISMARFSETQTRIAQDLKDLQTEQRNNNSQMNRQR